MTTTRKPLRPHAETRETRDLIAELLTVQSPSTDTSLITTERVNGRSMVTMSEAQARRLVALARKAWKAGL